jgi:hypothetical protein
MSSMEGGAFPGTMAPSGGAEHRENAVRKQQRQIGALTAGLQKVSVQLGRSESV